MNGENQDVIDDKGTGTDDTYDELTSVLEGKDVPGDEFTGIIGDEKQEDASDDNTGDDDNKDINDESATSDDKKDDAAEDEIVEDVDDKGDEDASKKEEPVDAKADTDPELIALVKKQSRQIAIMEAKLNRLSTKKTAKPVDDIDDIDDDDDVDIADKKPDEDVDDRSDIEKYQEGIQELAIRREEDWETMVELMELNPKFSDVREVCTENHFNDLFEVMAKNIVAEEGGDLVETQLAIEYNVWSKPNPYKFMYGLIKKHHADYQEADKDDTDKNKDKEKADADKDSKKTDKTPAKAPVSAVDLGRGGGDKDAGKWTATRIDAMPESDLHKVPEDVYDKYLRGELDT